MIKGKHRIFSTVLKMLLYKNNKPRKEIIKEYDLNSSIFNCWVRQYVVV